MKLQDKVLFLIGVIVVAAFGVVFPASHAVILGGFSQMEEDVVHKDVERVLNAMSEDLMKLSSTAADYAARNDTYAFIQGRHGGYVTENLMDSTFKNLVLNFVLFFNSSGQFVYGKAFDLNVQREIPVPSSLTETLQGNNFLLRQLDPHSSKSGILLLPEGPILIASSPIVTTLENGPIIGTLIMGLYMDGTRSGEIMRLAEVAGSSITIYSVNDPQMPADFRAASSSLSGAKDSIFVSPLNENSVAGYSIISDIFSEPCLMLRVDMPRSIYSQGLTLWSCYMTATALISLGFVFSFSLLLNRSVLSPLTRLSIGVNKVGGSGEISERLEVRGNDEFSNLASAINGMLEKIQITTQQLQDTERRSILRESEERVKAIEQIEEERRRLSETKLRLISSATHELKTPLVSIKGYTECVLSGSLGEVPPPVRDALEVASRNIDRLLNLIKDLMDIQRIDTGMLNLDMKTVNLSEVVKQSIKDMDLAIKSKKQKLELMLPNDGYDQVLGDRVRLQQVMLNLLSNAIKFTPEGGNLKIFLTEKDGSLNVSVSDSGIGINVKYLDQIFEPFVKIPKRVAAEGTGLGLSVAKRIIELHGGKIWAESQGEGKGSTFTFVLKSFKGGR